MKTLIKQTLANRFNLDNFTPFIKNFFNEIEIDPQEINVAKGLEEYIKKFLFLGEFSDVEKKNIDVLAVELSGDTKVERARSFQRNLIAKYLKDNFKDAGLVAFYSKDNPDWRLSFVKMDYKLTDKGAKVEVGTPPKRYSFLIGETEPSHTAQKQLLPILEDHKNNPLISEIEEAFSVEKVTKEFYEKYRGLFENLSKDLKKNRSFQIIASKENIDIENFAKKLLGQIVFLYFLQKKGWLGVPLDKTWGQGDKFFLRTLFEKAKKEKKNFYDSYLEPFFYDTLNNPRRDEVDPAYSRYFDCKIPFLNGGLFDPDYDWKNTIVYLENDIFEDIIGTFNLYNFTVKEDEPLEKEVAVDPEMLGKVFENLLPENLRKGQGTYYTPREIVHYMCQESLINYLATETKVEIEKIRKLVTFKDNIITKEDYFESINNSDAKHKIAEKILTLWENEIELLDKALANIKVCDPACGSGAFLVGMLNEIVGARRILGRGSEYRLKKETIQNSIYGVDIDPGAVEIAKLRLWLSLVVDYELKDIEPLPNLDYKIMCGNSLLEELIIGDESIKLFDERLLNLPKSNKQKNGLFDEEDFKGRSGAAKNEYLQNLLKTKQRELLELHSKNQLTQEKKQKLEQEIDALNKELNPKSKKIKGVDIHPTLFGEKAERFFNTLKELHKQYFTEYDPQKKRDKRKQIEDIETEFIKSSIKEKVDEIDNRIRNLNMQLPEDRKKQAELMKKKLEYLAIPEQIHNSKSRPYFLWKLNFFEVFQEKDGFDIVVANPPYVRQEEIDYKSSLQNEYEIFNSISDLYTYFYEKGFKLLKNFGVLTFITSNKFMRARYGVTLRGYLKSNTTIKGIINFGDIHVFDAITNTLIFIAIKERPENNTLNYSDEIKEPNKIRFSQNELQDREWTIDRPEVICLKNKIENKGTLLKDWNIKMFRGLLTGYNEAYIIDTPTKERLCRQNNKNVDLIKPIIRGRNIREYFHNWNGEWVLFIPWHFPLQNDSSITKASKEAEKIFAQTYPSIFQHFSQFKEKLVKRNQAETGIRYEWYAMQRYAADYLDHFKKEKIIWIELTDKNRFSYSEKEEYILAGAFMMTGESLKFLLAFLNSKLCLFYFSLICNSSGMATTQWKKFALEKLPIMKLSEKDQTPFIALVDKIITITKSADYLTNTEKQAKVKEYERQIDQMVYDLYGLRKEEIAIVEQFGAKG